MLSAEGGFEITEECHGLRSVDAVMFLSSALTLWDFKRFMCVVARESFVGPVSKWICVGAIHVIFHGADDKNAKILSVEFVHNRFENVPGSIVIEVETFKGQQGFWTAQNSFLASIPKL